MTRNIRLVEIADMLGVLDQVLPKNGGDQRHAADQIGDAFAVVCLDEHYFPGAPGMDYAPFALVGSIVVR